MVGDNESDIAAARSAGLAGAVHVMTGHGAAFRKEALGLEEAGFAVLPAKDLGEDPVSASQPRLAAEQ